MEIRKDIDRDIELRCPKCEKKKVKVGGKREQTQKDSIPTMIDQPTVFNNVRQKICTMCKYKVAYVINSKEK